MLCSCWCFFRDKEERLLDRGNIGEFYKYVNNRIVSRNGIGVSNDDSGFPVTGDQSKANLFNDFYSSVLSKDNNSMPKVEQFVDEDTNLSEISISPDLVFRAISKLKSKRSAGPDGYSSDLSRS